MEYQDGDVMKSWILRLFLAVLHMKEIVWKDRKGRHAKEEQTDKTAAP